MLLLLSVIPFLGYFYYMLLQTYVLKFEIILNMIGIIFLCLEIMASIYSFAIFVKHEKSL